MMKEEAAIKQPCSSMALKWAELKQHYFTDCGRPRRRLGGTASEHTATYLWQCDDCEETFCGLDLIISRRRRRRRRRQAWNREGERQFHLGMTSRLKLRRTRHKSSCVAAGNGGSGGGRMALCRKSLFIEHVVHGTERVRDIHIIN